jgi:deoxyribonuclease V
VSHWPETSEELVERQLELAARADEVEPWSPPTRPLRVAAAFCAFPSGLHGPGSAGDPAWTAAVVWTGHTEPETGDRPASRAGTGRGRVAGPGRVLAEAVQSGVAGAPYIAGLLGLRVGESLEDALRSVGAAEPDVLLLDATGRDHPRGAGLALHLGAALGVPSVGVTNRVLVAVCEQPEDRNGAVSGLRFGGRLVGYALRARAGANPLLIHAAWRTDPATALAVVQPLIGRWRTPEPLRVARHAARVARARAEGRYPR